MFKSQFVFKVLLKAVFISLLFFNTVNAMSQHKAMARSYRLEAKQDYVQALSVLESLPLKASQNSEFIILRKAWLNYLQKNYNQAIRLYKQAAQLNRNSLDAPLGEAMALLAQLRWKEAARVSRKVLKQAPTNYTAHLRLMVSEMGQKKWQALFEHARQVSQWYPTQVTPLLYMARASHRLGQTESAVKAYQSVLLHLPKNQEALNYIASNQ